MGRPPTPVGTFGKVGFHADPSGRVRARVFFRDYDGVRRPVTRWGNSQASAERALKAALAERQIPGDEEDLSGNTLIRVLAARWLAQVDESDELASGSKRVYHSAVTAHVLPGLGSLRIRECKVPAIDRLLKAVKASSGAGAATSCRKVLSGMFALAVKHGAVTHNPVRDASKISRTKKPVRAFTDAERQQVVDGLRASDRAVYLDLPDLVEFMLGTGVRIGEALAVRESVLELDEATRTGTVDINATVIRVKGEGLSIQEHPKSAAGVRTLAVPAHLVDMLIARRAKPRIKPPGGVVFGSPRGKLRDPSNTSADIKEVFEALGFGWVTSHVFRKTALTRLDRAGLSAREIADVAGHSKVSMTQDVYMGRGVASSKAAEVLDG